MGEEVPDVAYSDIYHYLIKNPSLFTRESLKIYKSLRPVLSPLLARSTCFSTCFVPPARGRTSIILCHVKN